MYSDLPLDYRNTFDRYLFQFKCIGIDFFDKSISYLNRNSVKFIVFVLSFYPFMFGQFTLISHITAESFLETVRVVPVNLMFFINVVKMAIALIRKADIRNMIVDVGELWPKHLEAGDPKAAILKAWLRQIKIPLDLFFKYAVINLALFEMVPLLMTLFKMSQGVVEYELPFQPPNWWEVNSLFRYLLTYLWMVAAATPVQMCLYLPFDLTVVVMTSNVSALFRLLQVDLETAIKIHDGEHPMKEDIHVADPDSYEEVKRIVKIHQRLLRIAEQLSKIFGVVIFIHMVSASLVICFFGFLAVVYSGLADTIANLMTVFNAMTTIFFLTLSGQFLCDTSSQIADAAYQSYWYESNLKVKKLILTIIIRAQRPSYLSALGFSELTLGSFSKIISSAWTYFSLLIQVYEES
uniref:Odorant receptor n=1 Tax=Mythimna separata TaxID=271217 RepID=A0A7H1DH73_MYTSE|nr:olfactory receptor 4a [Mythimna separata]